MDGDVDAIFDGAVLVVDVAPGLNQDVNFGSLLIFPFSSATLFLFCAPLKHYVSFLLKGLSTWKINKNIFLIFFILKMICV